MPLVYDELHRLAASYLRRERDNHTLQPTALVHEAYLRLVDQHSVSWQNRAQFFGLAARVIDEHGKSQDGFLRANEIYNLNLPAELVVLSACQTGLGKEIRGEGLVGLTRGFIYAGAARVAEILWGRDIGAGAAK